MMAAGWFVGPVMAKLINSFSEYLEDQINWQTGMKKELERLRGNLPKIQAVVFAANQTQFGDQDPALNTWLWQLRDAIDEADDLLDEIEYMKYKKQVAKTNWKTKVRKLRKIGERALKIDPNLKRLEKMVHKLDEISAQVGTFLHLIDKAKQEQQEQQVDLRRTRETGPLPRNDLIGRSKDKEFVLQWLRQPSNEEHETQITATSLHHNISLLSIVGHGGMGKTALLQHVYEDEIANEFDLKMWVCVSNNFDAIKVIADMLENLEKTRPYAYTISTLQVILKYKVQSKKFLLILDDIWDEEERDKSKWEDVLAPLAYGNLGSKILVTTRTDSVAAMITKVIKKKKETLILKGLEEDECLELLNTHAFADVESPEDHKRLRSLAIEIAKKLSGSPLAAKVIGSALNSSLDERHWIKVLDNDSRLMEFGQNDILPILRLSYMFLPRPLQNCFAFCSIFPQDHMIEKDDLVQMWIAVGFVQQPSNSGETMEDIGERYFDNLVKKSFFDTFFYRTTFYKMHDLLHELAQSVFAQESFRLVHDKNLFSRIPNTIRHLVVNTNNLKVLKGIVKFKNLRSLYLKCYNGDQEFVDVLNKILKASRSLRLLHLNAPFLNVIPEAIGGLIHLRYLDFTCYPRTLSPRSLSNLSNLRHLKLPTYGIHGIGNLTSLQNLNQFNVKNENGYRIGELEHMNNLRLLRIICLENVKDAMEVCNANLCDKWNLTELSLMWGDFDFSTDTVYLRGYRNSIVDPDLDERVFDNIQPHKNLKKLKIGDYMGVRSAIWMNLISNLEEICLVQCLEWQKLPPFGQLPFLKSLYLMDMPKVKLLENKFSENDRDCSFPSLAKLEIEKLEALEEWFDAAAAHDCFFPCLTELRLKDCPNMKELPYLPPKLEILDMINIGWKTLNFFSISKSIPLRKLSVRGCPNITYIPLADEISRLAALRDLAIVDCPNLTSLGVHQEVEIAKNRQLTFRNLSINDPSLFLMEPLRSCTILNNLDIERNDELVSFPTEVEQRFLQVSSSLYQLTFWNHKSLQSLPSSLESLSSLQFLRLFSIPLLKSLPDLPLSLYGLELSSLQNLDCLPSCLPSLSSLQHLHINNVPQLQELPDLPPSLKYLSITTFNAGLMERYKKSSGSHWHKIAHIPEVLIEEALLAQSCSTRPQRRLESGTAELNMNYH